MIKISAKVFDSRLIMKSLSVALCIILASCSVMQQDKTEAPFLADIANQCFEVKKDSLVYEIGCVTLENSVFASRCLAIQALGEPCLPETKSQFDSNPEYWEKKMYRCGKAGKKTGRGIVFAGTRLKIVKIINNPGPELYHHWNIKARIATGTHAGDDVFLPVYPSGQMLRPKWLHPSLIYPSEESSVPKPDPQFLVRCD
ncbi:MAG: hypothetical protein GY814_20490 [Gammaproteobacteria bacterium]|nr:hypothetical protein [Gammaproteobacteria bacterium]